MIRRGWGALLQRRSRSSEARERTIRVVLQGEAFELLTADGVFSAEHLDTGTAVLLASVPPPATEGDLLDLGCGWGPIAIALARRSPDASVWAVDVNERALALAAANARIAGVGSRPHTPRIFQPTSDSRRSGRTRRSASAKSALHELLRDVAPAARAGRHRHGSSWRSSSAATRCSAGSPTRSPT